MWYLSALFFWRLLTPVFTPDAGRGRDRGGRGDLSLVAGIYAGDTLDLARVLGLLPFFVLGLTATPERLERLREPWVRNAALLVFLAHRGGHHLDRPAGRSTEWLYYRSQLRRAGRRRRPGAR